MTKSEVIVMMALLREAYPNYYKNKNKEELTVAVNLWYKHFKDEEAQMVNAAVDSFVATDTKGFPPLIGQIKEKLMMLTTPNELTEQEAWNLVSKAIRNSAYHATEEYEKLPETVKQIITPSQLYEWSQMEGDSVQSVVASNFMRSYKAKATSNKEYQALPNDVKQLISGMSNTLSIEGGRSEGD